MSESRVTDGPSHLISESNYFTVAALDLSGVFPVETKAIDGRIWFFFSQEKAKPIIDAFDTGELKASLRDYAACITRTKTKIFSIERAMRR